MAKAKTKQQLTVENEELRARLQEMEDTLEAIRSGAVDAIVASGPSGDRVFTLEGADHAYHVMVESMNEGAVTLLPDGTVLYGNRQFGQMTGASPSEIVGRRFHDFVSVSDYPILDAILDKEGLDCPKTEIRLGNDPNADMPVQISASPIELGGAKALTLVITDLSAQRRYEEIVAAEKLSRRILEQAQEAIAVCINGCIVRANRAFYEICGRFPLMQPFDLVFPLRMSDSGMFSIAMPDTGKTIQNREVRYQRPDGKIFDLVLNAGPLVGKEHKVLGSLISLLDITERKQAMEERERLHEDLKRYASQLDAVFTVLPNLVSVHGKDGSYLRVNPALVKLFGFDPTKATREEIARRVRAHFPDGQPLTTENMPSSRALKGESVHDVEYRIINDRGEERVLLVNAIPLKRGDEAYGAVLSQIDITERKQAEHALQTSEARLRFALETSHTGAWDLDLVDHTAFRSLEHDRIFGYAELLPQWTYEMFLDHVLAEDRAAVDAKFRHATETQSDWSFECRIRRTDGKVRWIWAAGRHRSDATGAQRRMAGIVQDITERKQAEMALQEANETLEQRVRERTMDLQNLMAQLELSRHELRKLASELVMAEERERKRVAGVLHDEIAQTLAAARMRVDMVQGIPSDQEERIKEAKALLVQSIRETRSLMNDLGNPLLFDMGLQAACESLAERLMRIHPVRIRCDIRDAYKRLDPDVKIILYQLIRELLNNIVKHSQAQNAHVAIDTENGIFRVKVTDDGVGFDPETLGAPTAEGGFGLYSIRERLIAVDGTLRIESAPGAGTTVTATVPTTMR
jgi:PAS domain S-box-containing protein